MKKEKLIWHTEQRLIDSLKNWDKNPRLISKQGLARLEQKIIKNGFHDVLIADVDGLVLSGNQRRRILQKLNVKEVTVLLPNRPLTDDEKNSIALESNFHEGDWDFEGLKSFKLDLLGDIGFDKNELMNIWNEHLEVHDDDWDEEKEIEKARDTDIKPGDIFSLGKHRLICGSSLDPNVVNKLMGDVMADFINIDPPFNINYSYKSGLGKRRNYGGTYKDNKTDEEYKNFIKKIMQNALSVTKLDAHVMFWSDEKFVWIFQLLYKELGINCKRLLVWLKNNSSPTPQVAFNKIAEFIVYGTRGKPYLNEKVTNLHEVVNKGITSGNNVHDEIMDQMNILMVKRLPSNQYKHPTQKSPSLHEKSLRRCTQPGEIVLDLTAGSGSIMSACEQLKRVAYMCEYEPVFCQVILNHYKKLTGLNPIKIYEKK